jgi:hypothetical protein
MADWLTIAKNIVELGALGTLLILMVKLWCDANNDLKVTMKEHTRELVQIQSDHNKELTGLLRQYDSTLNAVNATLTLMEAGKGK